MLAELAAEPDILIQILTYLPLRSISRLYSTCSILNKFHARHQKIIRNSLQVNFQLIHREESVRFSIDVDDLATVQIEVGNDANLVTTKSKAWHLTDEIVANKQEDGCWRISEETMTRIETTKELLSITFEDSQFQIVDLVQFNEKQCHHPDCEWLSPMTCDFSKMLICWLRNDNRRVTQLVLPVKEVNEEEISSIVTDLHVRQLILVKHGEDNFPRRRRYNEDEWDLTRGFFQKHPDLHVFKANDLNCEISDVDLKHFDSLVMTFGRLDVTLDGVLAWARRKLTDGRFGDALKVVMDTTDRSDLLRRLESEFVKGKSSHFESTFRGPTGTWMEFKSSENHIHLSILESFEFPTKFLENPKKRFDLPAALVDSVEVFATLKKTYAKVQLRVNKASSCGDHFQFQFTRQRPKDGLVVEIWADDVFLYNLGHRKYTVYVAGGEVGDIKTAEVLQLLGRKLRHLKFTTARCESEKPDAALRLLQMINAGYQGEMNRLTIYAQRGPSVELLHEVVKAVQPKRFTFSFSKCSHKPRWILPEGFFADTPSLREFTLRPLEGWTERHFLGVTDETLQRFAKFKAPSAQTLVTRDGLERWITSHLEVESINFDENTTIFDFRAKQGKTHARLEREYRPGDCDGAPCLETEEMDEEPRRRLLSIYYMEAFKMNPRHVHDEDEIIEYEHQGYGDSSEWDSCEEMWAYFLARQN